VDGVGRRRHAHHLRPAPGDRAQVGVGQLVRLDHQPLGGVDFGDRIGNFEIKNVCRTFQPFGVRGAFEHLAAIGALAFEHAARIVQAVGQHVNIRLRPRHQLAVKPDDAIELVE
jgi:hypothetical protein